MKKDLHIAISIAGHVDGNTLYANGISQNIILLFRLFELLGHEVVLIADNHQKDQKLSENQVISLYTVDQLKEDKWSIDLFFEAGAVIAADKKDIIKSLGAKLISINYGNSITIDMENIIYSNDEKAGFQHIPHAVDYILVSPHHIHQASYVGTIFQADVGVIPFIWDPDFIIKKNFRKKDVRKKPNIYVMEPNLSVIKNALIPMAIIETLHRQDPESFHQAFIFNALDIKDKPYFLNNIVSNMASLNASATKDKVFFSRRRRFDDVFSYPDILLSHQWKNALNYLSLEALYHNIPLVHNSEFLQEVGYFYPDFDVTKGAEALLDGITHHKDNFAQQQNKNQSFLHQFSITSKTRQKEYQELIEKLLSLPEK